MEAKREGSGRAVIEGVRKMSWYNGEMCEFASALVGALQALGDDVPYPFVMGACGAAFRITLNRTIWDPGSYGIHFVADDPDLPVRRALEAVGRDYTLRPMAGEAEDTAAIRASIDRGVPVLAFGVVGPADCSLITGYDDGGRTLLGWSTFQDIPDDHNIPPDATGYFRKPEWHGNTRGYVLLGAKRERPARREVFLDTLRWAAELVHQEQVRGLPAGLGAYTLFADAMLRDAGFPPGDAQVLGGPYLGILCILMMVDDRRSAVDFLEDAAGELPGIASELRAAAECYRETCRLRDSLRSLVPEDFSEAAMLRLADPGVRRQYAEVIQTMRDSDAEAIRHVEQALARQPSVA